MGAESKVPEICEDPSEKMKEKDRKPPPSPDEKAPGTGSSQAEAAGEKCRTELCPSLALPCALSRAQAAPPAAARGVLHAQSPSSPSSCTVVVPMAVVVPLSGSDFNKNNYRESCCAV